MIKKLTIILLSLVLIIFPFSILAFAEGNPTIIIDAPAKVNNTDDSFAVQLKISNFSYLKNATIVVGYDTSAINLVDYQLGGIYENENVRSVSNGDGEIVLTIQNESGFSVFTDGVLLTMYFVANESAGGNSDINVRAYNAVDDADNSLSFEQKGATIYITPGQTFIPGEISTETTVPETESSTFVDITTTEPVTEDNSANEDKPSVVIYVVIAVVGVAVLGAGVGYYIYNSNKRKGD